MAACEQVLLAYVAAWQPIDWREGTKGTMQAQAVALRVHWATGSPRHSTSHSRVQTGPEGWRLSERSVSQTPAADQTSEPPTPQEPEEVTIKHWFSTLPEDASVA